MPTTGPCIRAAVLLSPLSGNNEGRKVRAFDFVSLSGLAFDSHAIFGTCKLIVWVDPPFAIRGEAWVQGAPLRR